MNHTKFMERALELAELGKLTVSPNPAVGAVLVKNDTVIGEGFHKGPGTLHAEIEAIESAKVSILGATLYTTLEPCCTIYPGKKQKPCTDRIVKERIAHVVISMKDPNKHVMGKGISQLKKAGIEVTTGILVEETRILNKVFIKNMRDGLPYVNLKIAQTIDGKIATANGHSKWITDNDAREDVQRLRSEYDAILIGSKTASIDNPLLTVRTGKMESLHRFVLNRDLTLPMSLRLFDNILKDPTTVCIDKSLKIDSARKLQFTEKGIGIMEIDCGESNMIPIKLFLNQLYAQGICSLIVEGGSAVYTSFIREKLFDEITFYIAPRICGTGKSSFGQLDTISMNDSLELKRPEVRMINNQFVLTAFRN